MNKQISKLIKQATTIRYSGPGEIEEFDKEKFAELIVKECAKVSNQYVGWRIGDIDLGMVYKEHFGVEE